MLDELSILLTPFNTHRTIRVYTPDDYYDTNKSYPVLYMHDGKNIFRDEDAVGGVSLGLEAFLDKTSFQLIAIGIDANPSREGRVDEYCPWVNGEFSKKILGSEEKTGGKGGAYIDFIVNELKPLIDSKYRTLSDKTYMAGVSLGGLISVYAACSYPGVFSRIAGISSGFYRNQEEIEKLLYKSDLSSIERFYLDCGTEEAGDDHLVSEEFVNSNKAVTEILKSKVPNLKFQTIAEAKHNYTAFKERVPEVFSFLFSEVNATV